MTDETRKTLNPWVLTVFALLMCFGVAAFVLSTMDSLEGASRVVFLAGICIFVIVIVIIAVWLESKKKAEKHDREMQDRAFKHEKELAELKARSKDKGD